MSAVLTIKHEMTMVEVLGSPLPYHIFCEITESGEYKITATYSTNFDGFEAVFVVNFNQDEIDEYDEEKTVVIEENDDWSIIGESTVNKGHAYLYVDANVFLNKNGKPYPYIGIGSYCKGGVLIVEDKAGGGLSSDT